MGSEAKLLITNMIDLETNLMRQAWYAIFKFPKTKREQLLEFVKDFS